ncbi:MAG: hypothetical protein ACRYF8_01625 [Janthinobacterium lividum]|jgi:hypothetical protein
MMDGAKEGQLSSDSGGYGDIYSLSGNDWTPMGVIGNPYLDAIKKSGADYNKNMTIIRTGIVATDKYSGWQIIVANDRDGDTGGYYLYLKKSAIGSFDYWFEHEAGLKAQLVDFEVEWVV